MAGEWIAYDLALPAKPEVQELIDVTGEPVDVVVFRLLQLWGWASMHCADGTARMTIPRLARTCGGDDAFWRAVAAVGWLEIDETAATVAVPGWDRRFSQAAKARLQARDRERAYEERSGRPPARERRNRPAPARGDEPAPARGRGEERTGEVPPPPREDSQPDPAAWETLRAAWNKGAGTEARRRPWKPAQPPDEAMKRLSEPGWLETALEAIPRLRACRYFKTWVGLDQFCGKPKFAMKVVNGSYDDVNEPKAGSRGPEDRPPPQGWTGDDAARLEATRRKMLEQLRAEAAT
jgi:hypothetical protein